MIGGRRVSCTSYWRAMLSMCCSTVPPVTPDFALDAIDERSRACKYWCGRGEIGRPVIPPSTSLLRSSSLYMRLRCRKPAMVREQPHHYDKFRLITVRITHAQPQLQPMECPHSHSCTHELAHHESFCGLTFAASAFASCARAVLCKRRDEGGGCGWHIGAGAAVCERSNGSRATFTLLFYLGVLGVERGLRGEWTIKQLLSRSCGVLMRSLRYGRSLRQAGKQPVEVLVRHTASHSLHV